MLAWITKNKCAVSDSIEETLSNQKIRAILSVSKTKNQPINKNIELRAFDLDEISLFETRELILEAHFFEKIGFPFAIYSDEGIDKPSLFAIIYLIYQGKSKKNAISKVIDKTSIKLSAQHKKFINSVSTNIELFQLNKTLYAFFIINEFIRILRHQCPWDMEQTHSSLIPELIEEPLELAEEIKRGNNDGIKEELGDVLLQILLHSIIGEEENKFDITGVIDNLYEKMYERHPHVFKESKVKESKEVLKQWEDIKKNKNRERTLNISKILASFITTVDIQETARKDGLDFSSVKQIEEKITEELKELKGARKNKEELAIELGDLLFSVINLARFLKIDPAHALFLSMDKFNKRFKRLKEQGIDLKNLPSKKIDKMWEEIKKNEQFRQH